MRNKEPVGQGLVASTILSTLGTLGGSRLGRGVGARLGQHWHGTKTPVDIISALRGEEGRTVVRALDPVFINTMRGYKAGTAEQRARADAWLRDVYDPMQEASLMRLTRELADNSHKLGAEQQGAWQKLMQWKGATDAHRSGRVGQVEDVGGTIGSVMGGLAPQIMQGTRAAKHEAKVDALANKLMAGTAGAGGLAYLLHKKNMEKKSSAEVPYFLRRQMILEKIALLGETALMKIPKHLLGEVLHKETAGMAPEAARAFEQRVRTGNAAHFSNDGATKAVDIAAMHGVSATPNTGFVPTVPARPPAPTPVHVPPPVSPPIGAAPIARRVPPAGVQPHGGPQAPGAAVIPPRVVPTGNNGTVVAANQVGGNKPPLSEYSPPAGTFDRTGTVPLPVQPPPAGRAPSPLHQAAAQQPLPQDRRQAVVEQARGDAQSVQARAEAAVQDPLEALRAQQAEVQQKLRAATAAQRKADPWHGFGKDVTEVRQAHGDAVEHLQKEWSRLDDEIKGFRANQVRAQAGMPVPDKPPAPGAGATQASTTQAGATQAASTAAAGADNAAKAKADELVNKFNIPSEYADMVTDAITKFGPLAEFAIPGLLGFRSAAKPTMSQMAQEWGPYAAGGLALGAVGGGMLGGGRD